MHQNFPARTGITLTLFRNTDFLPGAKEQRGFHKYHGTDTMKYRYLIIAGFSLSDKRWCIKKAKP